MSETQEIEALFFQIMRNGRMLIREPIDLSVERITELTKEITNPTKNNRMILS